MSQLGGVTGLIGTAVGLAVLVGVAGLAFRAIDRTFDSDRDRKRKGRRRDDGLFGGVGGQPTRATKGTKRKTGVDNIFDLGLTQGTPKRTRKSKFRNEFGGDFNIFAV